jgi:uncharacterized protein (DUF934 family)
MSLLSHTGAEATNVWQFFNEESPPPAWRNAAYPLVYWRDAIEVIPHLPRLADGVGLWLKTADDVHAFAKAVGDVNRVKLIAVQIPKFVDGRSYSIATLLRRRYGFQGELRAVGDVLADQVLQLARCGFDTFALREDRADAAALSVAKNALGAFSQFYQPNVVHHADAVSFA